MKEIPALNISNNKMIKKHSDMKIRSVSRSFSRRKHNTQHSMTMEPSVGKTPTVHFNFKLQKNQLTGSEALYKKLKTQAAMFGVKSSKKDSLKPHSTDIESNREVLFLNSIYRSKDYKKTIEEATNYMAEKKSLKSNPNVHFLVAMSFYKLEDYASARLHFEETLKLKEKYKKSVYIFLAICLNNLKLIDEAQNILNKAIAFYPNFYEAKVASSDRRSTTRRSSARRSSTKMPSVSIKTLSNSTARISFPSISASPIVTDSKESSRSLWTTTHSSERTSHL